METKLPDCSWWPEALVSDRTKSSKRIASACVLPSPPSRLADLAKLVIRMPHWTNAGSAKICERLLLHFAIVHLESHSTPLFTSASFGLQSLQNIRLLYIDTYSKPLQHTHSVCSPTTYSNAFLCEVRLGVKSSYSNIMWYQCFFCTLHVLHVLQN